MPIAPGGVVFDAPPAAALAGALSPGVGAAVAPWKLVVAGVVSWANAPVSGIAGIESAKTSLRMCLLIVLYRSLTLAASLGEAHRVVGNSGGQALWPRAVSRSLLYSGVNTRARSPRFRPISDSSRSVIARSSARS